MKIKRGSTSVRRLLFIGDSSSTTGAGLANLAHNTAGLVAWYFAGDLSNDLQITLASATLGTFTSGGFVAVDNTNMPGWYEFGIPNAVLDGGNEVAIQLRGAANMLPVNIYIELDAFDYQTATQPVNVTQFGGTNGTFSGGRPEVTVATNNDKTGYSLSQSFPTNFASLAITGGGAVTAGTVSDKTGYSLTQTFPTNFASLAITGGGAVTAGTVSDKTGYSLTTAPLDAAGVRAAVGLASANLDTQFGTLATASVLSDLVNTVGIAGAGLTEAGGTGDQFTALPRVGATLRYTQVAANSGSKTADVSIGAAS